MWGVKLVATAVRGRGEGAGACWGAGVRRGGLGGRGGKSLALPPPCFFFALFFVVFVSFLVLWGGRRSRGTAGAVSRGAQGKG